MHKKLLTLICLLGLSSFAFAQDHLPPLDVSPMDMSYYPANYTSGHSNEKLVCRLIYSRPQKKGREIFGKLEPFGKVDRLGANEANELDIFSPVTIGGTQIQPGRYTMYAIFNPDKWTMIISKKTDTWGAFSYDEKMDVVRTDIPVQKLDNTVEALTMVFQKADDGANLVIEWDKTKAVLPIKF